MMKFFALVALAVFATANASTAVTDVTPSRSTGNDVAGAAGGNLVVTFTATTQIPNTGTITVATAGPFFTANADTPCTATVTQADGTTAVTPAPTFAAGAGGTASSGDITGHGGATETLTLTMGGGTNDVVAAGHIITITCMAISSPTTRR